MSTDTRKMDQKRARQIVKDCIRFQMWASGSPGNGKDPPVLDYTLSEMVEANHILEKEEP